jgi:hypothetical protein
VNTISRAKNVATRDTIEAEHRLPGSARPLKGSRKRHRLAGIQADELAIWPLVFRPIAGRIKCRSAAARVQTGSETEQVGFGPAALGISPADKTDFGGSGRFDHCERNFFR